MASRYWVGGTDTWNTTAGSKWATTSGGAGGAAVPTAADDVFFDASSSGTCTLSSSSVCRSLDCNGFTGTISHPASTTLTIGDGTAGAGNVALKLTAGMTYTLGSSTSSAIAFASTSATQQTITTAGKSTGSLTFSGASGSWQFQDDVTAGSITQSASNTVDYNGKTYTLVGGLAGSGGGTKVMTFGASTFNIGGNIQFAGTITIASNTATFNCTNSNANHSIAGQNMNGASITMTPTTGASNTLQGGTWNNVTYTGIANKTDQFLLSADLTCTGTFTCDGNSTTNRILIASSTRGTSRTITAATVTITNADLMDITGAGAGSWDLSAITGKSGDCGGNSGITFTTPATQTATGTASFTWSTHGWTSRVPLPQDDVVVNNAFVAGRTVTMDMPRSGKSLDFSGSTGAPTISVSVQNEFYGSLTLASNNVLSGTNAFQPSGRSNYTITTAGVTFTMSVFLNAPSGTYTLADAFTSSRAAANAIAVTLGTLDNATNNVTVTLTGATSGIQQTGGVFNMGSATYNIGDTAAANIWNNTGGTVNCGTSTIVITNTSTSTRTFVGGGQTYHTLTYTVDNSPGTLALTGANTFNTLSVDSGKAVTISATTTVNTFDVNGADNDYLHLSGVSGDHASTPDATPLDITGDISLQVEVAMTDWTPSLTGLLGKWRDGSYPSTSSYLLLLETNGKFSLYLSDGTTVSSVTSSAAPAFVDGTKYHVGVTYRTSDRRVQFWTSSDGSSWTQLGTDQTHGRSAIGNSVSTLKIGALSNGNNDSGGAGMATGDFYRAKVWSGVRDFNGASGGTLAFDADFAAKAVGADTFTESSSNAATVTINGATAKVGDGRVSIASSSAGTLRYLSVGSGQAQQTVNYVTFQDIRVIEPYKLFATNSTDTSNNFNITFSTAPAAPYIRQAKGVSSSATSHTLTFDFATTSGNLLLIALGARAAPGTLTPPTGFSVAKDNANTANSTIWYKVSDGTETTLTTTSANSLTNPDYYIYEVAGFTGTPTLDVTAESDNASSTSQPIGTVSNTQTPAFAIGMASGNGSIGAYTTVPTNSWQQHYYATNGTPSSSGVAAIPLTSTASQSSTITFTTARTGAGAMAIFYGVATGGFIPKVIFM